MKTGGIGRLIGELRKIDAFWSIDICWSEDGLLNSHEAGDSKRVRWWLETIWNRLETVDKK